MKKLKKLSRILMSTLFVYGVLSTSIMASDYSDDDYQEEMTIGRSVKIMGAGLWNGVKLVARNPAKAVILGTIAGFWSLATVNSMPYESNSIKEFQLSDEVSQLNVTINSCQEPCCPSVEFEDRNDEDGMTWSREDVVAFAFGYKDSFWPEDKGEATPENQPTLVSYDSSIVEVDNLDELCSELCSESPTSLEDNLVPEKLGMHAPTGTYTRLVSSAEALASLDLSIDGLIKAMWSGLWYEIKHFFWLA